MLITPSDFAAPTVVSCLVRSRHGSTSLLRVGNKFMGHGAGLRAARHFSNPETLPAPKINRSNGMSEYDILDPTKVN